MEKIGVRILCAGLSVRALPAALSINLLHAAPGVVVYRLSATAYPGCPQCPSVKRRVLYSVILRIQWNLQIMKVLGQRSFHYLDIFFIKPTEEYANAIYIGKISL